MIWHVFCTPEHVEVRVRDECINKSMREPKRSVFWAPEHASIRSDSRWERRTFLRSWCAVNAFIWRSKSSQQALEVGKSNDSFGCPFSVCKFGEDNENKSRRQSVGSNSRCLDTKTLRVVVGKDVSGHSLRGENLKNPKHEVVFWTPEYDVVGKNVFWTLAGKRKRTEACSGHQNTSRYNDKGEDCIQCTSRVCCVCLGMAAVPNTIK